MRHSLLALMILGLISVGCTSTNKAVHARNCCSTKFWNYSASSSSSPSSNPDQDFVTKAAQGNAAEVDWGKSSPIRAKIPT